MLFRVNTLLNDTGPESDQLRLLQHCLMRMWTIAQERSAAAGASLNLFQMRGSGPADIDRTSRDS